MRTEMNNEESNLKADEAEIEENKKKEEEKKKEKEDEESKQAERDGYIKLNDEFYDNI